MDCKNFPKLNELKTYQEFIIKSKYPSFYNYLMNNVVGRKWIEKLYCYYHGVKELPLCKTCGSPVNFINMKYGFRKYCCRQCCFKDSEWIETRNKTNFEKYGVSNLFQSKELRKKMEETWLKKYGVDNPNKNKEIHKKAEQTCLQKYGTTNPFASDEIKEKIKQTNLKKYGVDNPNKCHLVREKINRTCLEKYGVENPSSLEKIKQKRKETCIKKFGVECSFQSKELRKKAEQTSMQKYGFPFYTQTEEYQIRANKTKKEKHTFNSSKIETVFMKWLDENNIEYDYQHNDNNYPFNCDFYFPKFNTYLEIQGFWAHGKHPYNPNDCEDIKMLNSWINKPNRSYKQAIETWTIKDPLKRKIAKENNIKLIEVFNPTLDKLINEVTKFKTTPSEQSSFF